VRYIGMTRTPESQQQLVAIYNSSSDIGVKREILRSLQQDQARDQIFNLAKAEKDPDLRLEAIRQLGGMRAGDQLTQLYASESSVDNKRQIIRSLNSAGATDKLVDLAKNEKDPELRIEAIRNVGYTRGIGSDTLTSLYAADSDAKTRRELVNTLFSRGEARPLIDLARKETDPVMKKYIVERLGTMRNNKEATDYMMELLK
jgi:HEAT repeat protein